ncbi:protein translocase subunit SecF [Patescibacteria group bacterium]|nr:protein translocase subunit SecF [Patescibacteria group bacterium]
MYNIIQKRKIWLVVSATFIIPSIIMFSISGLKLGIDFTGGSLIQVGFADERPSSQAVADSLSEFDVGAVKAQPLGDSEMTIRIKEIDNETYLTILASLRENFGQVEERSFESIGPTIGRELREKALIAIASVLFFIILYISIAFRKTGSSSVKSWVYGLGALAALFHDIIIVVGVFSFLGYFLNVEVDTLFITALLTVLGFSVHDTIVVYDRVREQLKLNVTDTFEEVVNISVNQTIIRSLNTSLTTLLVLFALYLFGGESIRYFILALIIGIAVGTYSSIFIASPFLVFWKNITNRS